MKFVFSILVAAIPTTTCCFFAGYLASINAGGWGWFILAAVLLSPEINTNESKEAK